MKLYNSATIYEGFNGIRVVKGRTQSIVGPGRYRWWGGSTEIIPVPMTPTLLVIGNQEVLTQDHAPMRVGVGVNVRITDIALSLEAGMTAVTQWEPKQVQHSNNIHVLTQSSVRDYVAGLTLEQCLQSRDSFQVGLSEAVRNRLGGKGLEIVDVILIDFGPTGALKTALADKLRVEIEAQVALARARSEAATMRNLLNTAKLVRENPKLLELRMLTSGVRPRLIFNVSDSGSLAADPASALQEDV